MTPTTPVTPAVPNTYHFVFGLRPQTEPFALPYYLCLRSCIEINAPDRILFHCMEEPWGRYWDLIREELTVVPVTEAPEVLRHSYDDREVPPHLRYAHHADFIRLDVLIEHGGIYADIDTLFVAPLPPVLRDKSFVIGREHPVVDRPTGTSRPSLCNAVLLAEPGAPFARIWRERMEAALGGWSQHSTLLPRELADDHPEWVHIEPERTFYPFRWTADGLRRLFEDTERDLEGVVSIHLWSHLWWDAERTDFSDFHAGLLTEHRIRTVDSTYNRLARPFLPPFDPTWFARQAADE